MRIENDHTNGSWTTSFSATRIVRVLVGLCGSRCAIKTKTANSVEKYGYENQIFVDQT